MIDQAEAGRFRKQIELKKEVTRRAKAGRKDRGRRVKYEEAIPIHKVYR